MCCPLTLGREYKHGQSGLACLLHIEVPCNQISSKQLGGRKEEGAATAVAVLPCNDCVGCIMNKIISQMGKSRTEGEDERWKGN